MIIWHKYMILFHRVFSELFGRHFSLHVF